MTFYSCHVPPTGLISQSGLIPETGRKSTANLVCRYASEPVSYGEINRLYPEAKDCRLTAHLLYRDFSRCFRAIRQQQTCIPHVNFRTSGSGLVVVDRTDCRPTTLTHD